MKRDHIFLFALYDSLFSTYNLVPADEIMKSMLNTLYDLFT